MSEQCGEQELARRVNATAEIHNLGAHGPGTSRLSGSSTAGSFPARPAKALEKGALLPGRGHPGETYTVSTIRMLHAKDLYV